MDTREQQIEALWDGLAEFGPSRVDEGLDFVLAALAHLVDAQSASWFAAVRMSNCHPSDPTNGWRVPAIYNLQDSPQAMASNKEHVRRIKHGEIDASVLESLRNAGSFRINIISRQMPPEWLESEFYQSMYKAHGRQDGMFVAMPLSDEVESWFGFYREDHPHPRFEEREQEWMRRATRPLKRFLRQVALNHGVLLAEKPLNNSERRVLNALLTGKTAEQIAGDLKLSPDTVRTYTARICRKFNVSGRARLTALWLGG